MEEGLAGFFNPLPYQRSELFIGFEYAEVELYGRIQIEQPAVFVEAVDQVFVVIFPEAVDDLHC